MSKGCLTHTNTHTKEVKHLKRLAVPVGMPQCGILQPPLVYQYQDQNGIRCCAHWETRFQYRTETAHLEYARAFTFAPSLLSKPTVFIILGTIT